MKKRRGIFGRFGFILAATGSAIGLGNLWKFPYITWHNNGGAFVLIYLVSVIVIGWPIMMAEILIGRKTQKNPVPAFEELGSKKWSSVGWLGVITGLVILGYYCVIAGWTITSFIKCLGWSFSGYVKPADGAFDNFTSNGLLQLSLSFIFVVITALIIWRGVKRGIERTTKILMPILFGILIYLLIMVFSLPGINETLNFLFRANFSDLPSTAILEAVGHAFFTLSLGMGAMITYGSYMNRKESIARNAALVVFLDTLIAIGACVIMFTIIFSVPGVKESVSANPIGMLFVTLPNLLYTQIPFGSTLAPIFYILVGFAALSSTISLLEVLVSFLVDKLKMDRHKATIVAAASSYIITIFAALSLGALPFLSNLNIFGEGKNGVLSTLDHLASNWMLPVGGLFITIFVGWFMDKKICQDEVRLYKPDGSPKLTYKFFRFFIKFAAPLAILAVIIAVILGKDFS